jgi:hypothetical protein
MDRATKRNIMEKVHWLGNCVVRTYSFVVDFLLGRCHLKQSVQPIWMYLAATTYDGHCLPPLRFSTGKDTE